MAEFLHKNANYPLYLWEWRKARGLTAERLAEDAGIQRSLVSGLETGTRRANVDQLLAIAKTLGIHPAHLFRHPDDLYFKIEAIFDRLPDDRRQEAVDVLKALSGAGRAAT